MARVPGLSLSTRELEVFIRSRRRREDGQTSPYERWDVDSSNYGVEYLLMPSTYYEDDVKSKYLGALGNYLVEIRGYSRSVKSRGAFVGSPSFGWAIHSLKGTLQWDYTPAQPDGPVLGFRNAEQAGLLALTPAQVHDAFRVPTSPSQYGAERLYDGPVV